MSNIGDPSEIPTEYYKSVVDDVAKQEKFKNYTTCVTLASSKGENYLGHIYRIKITGTRDDKDDAELNLILKVPLQLDPSVREKFPIGTVYTREAYMYNTIMPKMKQIQDMFDVPDEEKVHFVKCYKASPENFKEFLILEDVCASGFAMAQRRSALPYANLKLALQTLARYHALSFPLKHMHPELFSEFAGNLASMKDYTSDSIDFFRVASIRAIEVLDDEKVREKLKIFSDDLLNNLSTYFEKTVKENFTVLCHGDCWNNNMLFQFKDEKLEAVRLIDWQIARNASPVTDIAYLIATSTDNEMRNNHFTELLDLYYETLAKALQHMGYDIQVCYPRERFENDLKTNMSYGLLLSFIVLPAVLGDVEDVPDMEAILKKDKLDASDFKFESKAASNRFEIRMRDLAKFYIDNKYI